MNVGFIGLGNMGTGMAANLIKSGHEVTVYNRTPDKIQPLVSLGGRAADQVAEACRGDVVITMLADDSAVESIVFSDSGIIASLRTGAIHVSMSTISVALSEKLVAAHARSKQRFVAAPVFGRPDVAAAAKLTIIAAGPQDALDECRPLFDALGHKTFFLGGDPTSANLVKLSGNFLIASIIEALSESMTLVGKGGVEPHQFVEFLTSTLFNAPVFKNYGSLIADKKFSPAGFSAQLGNKDIRLTLAASESLRVPMPLASLLRDRFLTLLAQGGGALDWSAIAQLAAKDAGQ